MNICAKRLAIALALGMAGNAQAVHLDSGGRGQVLIYPYYTVNDGQQTLLSVTNTTNYGQVVRVTFREGYNGREVRDFKLWLAPYDVWTATVFALEDAGLPGEGAAILSSDGSCTSPQLGSSGLSIDDAPYAPFVNQAFSGADGSDGGPAGLSRTREGWIEIIAMADVAEPLLTAISHGYYGTSADCMTVQAVQGGNPAVATRPSGGLIGTASVINVTQGTLLATRAEALGDLPQ